MKYEKTNIIELKRILSMVLIISMLFGFLPQELGAKAVYAQELTPDYSWYLNNVDNENFEIKSDRDLLAFANIVAGIGISRNDFSGKVIKVVSDIDLKNLAWVPIGLNEYATFNGTFDGDSHTIKGLHAIASESTAVVDTYKTYGGLFGIIGSSSIIKNIIILQPMIEYTGQPRYNQDYFENVYIGGIVGSNNGLIENCHVMGGAITASYYSHLRLEVKVGGIAGENYGFQGIINKSSSSANIEVNESFLEDARQYSSCVGGITGVSAGKINDCYAIGDLTNNSLGAIVAGIVGRDLKYSSINNCHFSGTVRANRVNSAYPHEAAGLVGTGEGYLINSYYDNSKVSNSTNSYGIALSSMEMKDQDSFLNWDFEQTWQMSFNFPVTKGICRCLISSFNITSSDEVIIPYGQTSQTYQLEHTIPTTDSSDCILEDHVGSGIIEFGYFIEPIDGSLENATAINKENKVITFTQAGAYEVIVVAVDSKSKKESYQSKIITVANEKCTCSIPEFASENQTVLIPYPDTVSSYTFIDPNVVIEGECQVLNHQEKEINYQYEIVDQDSSITSASLNDKTLTIEGEGKVKVKIIATLPDSSAEPVSNIREVTFNKQICNCNISDFTFDEKLIKIPYGENSTEYIFVDPVDAILNPCNIQSHNQKVVEYIYEIVSEDNTAEASINGKRLTVNKEGSFNVKITAFVPNTEASKSQIAKFTVQKEFFAIAEMFENIKALNGKDVNLFWDTDLSHDVTINVKDLSGQIVHSKIVNAKVCNYKIPSEALVSTNDYIVEMIVVENKPSVNIDVSIEVQTSLLFDKALTSYYDTCKEVTLTWKTTRERSDSDRIVTVKRGNMEYTNFTVSGDSVTIKGIEKPLENMDTYTVTVKSSYEGKEYASGSFPFSVYKTNDLEVIDISDNSLLTETRPLIISNQDIAASMSSEELLAKANSFKLQSTIKLKQGISTYGADAYSWSVQDSTIATISSTTGSKETYLSNETIVITGLKDGETTVTVKHILTQETASFKVKVKTLKDKLYVLQTSIKTVVNLNYTANGESKSVVSNANGMVAIYEPTGIDGSIDAKIIDSDTIYFGGIEKSKLLSAEATIDIGAYPVSIINVAEATKIILQLSAKNGYLNTKKALTIKGFLLKNDVIIDSSTIEHTPNDSSYENVILNFDTTKLEGLTSTDQLKFVYEITGGDYAPAYAMLDARDSRKASFGIVKTKLQLLKTNQSVYLNSMFLSESSSSYTQDVSSRTQYVIINEKIPSRTLKVNVCYPKGEVEIPTIINAKGDTIGASNITYKNLTLEGMSYGWQEITIVLDSNLIEDSKSLKFSYSFYNTNQRTITKIPNSFVVANIMGVKGAEKYNSVPFTGEVSTGSTGLKILGDKSFEFLLPSVLEVVMDYDLENDPLNGTFKMLIGYNSNMPNEDEVDYTGLINNVIDVVEKGPDAMGGGKSFGFKVVGFMMGNVAYRNGDWVLIPTSGGIIGAAEMGYAFSQTTVVGVIPVNYGVELKAGVEATLLIDSTSVNSGITKENFDEMFEFYLKIYGSIYAYGGIGFDAKIAAARIGIFGKLGLEYYFRTAVIDEIRRAGGQLVLLGSIGIEAVIKLLWFKKRYVLCEKGFEKDFKPNGFDFSSYGGFERPSFQGMEKMMMFMASDGKEYEIYESQFEIEDRDYLSKTQLWSGGIVNNSLRTLNITTNTTLIKDIATNVYPYADPILSSDGKLMVMLNDFGSTDINKTGAAYSFQDSDGLWSPPARIYDVKTPASNLTFSGTESFGAVAWESVKDPVVLDEEQMSDEDISAMISKSEIFASIYNGNNFTTTQITNNLETDMIPQISAKNGKAIVVWQKSSIAPNLNATEGENEILYSIFKDGSWSLEEVLDTGDAGAVKSFSTAMASDGTAVITLSIDTDKDSKTYEDMEVFNHYIYQDGTRSSRIVITSNESVDSNPQVIARELVLNGIKKEYFLTSWYNEKPSENEQNFVRNIMLDARDLEGNKVDGFISSFGEASANFSFIKSDDSSINTLGIVWSEAVNQGAPTSQKLYAKLLTDGVEGLATTSSFEITSSDPRNVELYGIETMAKKNFEGVELNSIYLKKNIEIGLDNSLKTTNTSIQSADILFSDSAEITSLNASVSSAKIQSILPIAISIKNSGFSKIIGFKVKANNQEFLFDSVLLPDQTTKLYINYMVEDFKDIAIEVVPIYSGGIEGKLLESSIKLLLPDISIESIIQTGTGDGGDRTFDVELSNNGTKALEDSGYKVNVSVFEEFDRQTHSIITDLTTGETKTEGIKISDNSMLRLIDEGKGKIRVGYKTSYDSYNSFGNKTLYINVSVINADGELIKDLNYLDNEGGVTFISPEILYPNQFEVTVVQNNIDGITSADLTVRNLHLVNGADTLKLSLLDEEQIIEEKTFNINIEPESTINQTVTFESSGTNILTTFGADSPEYTMSITTLTEFATKKVGYAQSPEAQIVTIINTGNQPIKLTQPKSTNYIVGILSSTNLAVGNEVTFTVQPKIGLLVGEYNEILDIIGSNSSNVSISAQFVVTEELDPDIAIVDAARIAIEGVTYLDMTQTVATDDKAIEDAIKDTVVTEINDSTVSVRVNKISYAESIAGTSENLSGENGSYTFTIIVSKGKQTQTTKEKTITIMATAYTGLSDVDAVAAAKTAIVDGTIAVVFGASQTVKTVVVQSYVNGLLLVEANGVTATVTYIGGNKYSVEISKGRITETKIITMMINQAPNPDIAIVDSAKIAVERTTYLDMMQKMAVDDEAIKNALKLKADAAINNSSVTTIINKVSYIEAIEGTSEIPNGTGGKYKFTITVRKGGQSDITTEKTINIVATPYTNLANYTVEGSVEDQDNKMISDANIKLMKGKEQIGLSTQTDKEGKFIIENVINGTYNIVISKDDITLTKLISVNNTNYVAGTITLFTGKRNSIVEIKGYLTPQIVVGGVDEQFNAPISDENDKGITESDNLVITDGGSVELKFTAEEKDDNIINAAEISATAALSDKIVGIFIDLSVLKTVRDNNGNEISSQSVNLTELPSLVEVFLPLTVSMQDKSDYVVYRYHGSDVDIITKEPNADGEKIELVDNNTIIKLTVKKFSTYAIAYESTTKDNLDRGISLETEESINQSGEITISTNKKEAIITPNDGYVIADVIFDGKSIGAIDSYSVTDEDSHTIKAIFVKKTAIPYYFEQGKKIYIGFSAINKKLYQYIAENEGAIEFEENQKNFEDNTVKWAKLSIEFVTEREIFLGTGQEMFSTNESMTRAMFVTVIGRLYERSFGIVSGTNTFIDVSENTYYTKYVAWANENGIIKGVGKNKFAPNDEITREQMAVIILNFATLLEKTENLDSMLEYADSESISSWAIEGAKYCQATQVIAGRNGRNFAPQEIATRAEVAVVIERFIKKIVSSSE